MDDSRLSHHQFPNWVLSEDPSKGKENDGHFGMHPRLTRMGVKFEPVEQENGNSLHGVIETDFQNGGSESRQILRIRHAYFNLKMGAFHFLAGQTGAVDRKDLDRNGVLDGSEAMRPFVQARVGLAQKRLKAGVWTHWGAEETATPVGGDSSFTSMVVGVDASVALSAKLAFEGEGWSGSNLSDIRGGIGQGINQDTGEEIASAGGWGHLVVKPNPRWKLFAGAMMDAPDEDEPARGRPHQEPGLLPGRPLPALAAIPGGSRVYQLANRVQGPGGRHRQPGGSPLHLLLLRSFMDGWFQ